MTTDAIDPMATPAPKRRPWRPRLTPAQVAARKHPNNPAKTSHQPDPLYKDKNSINDNLYIIDNLPEVIASIEKAMQDVDLKGKMSPQELKFIEAHLVRGLPIRRAMVLAGYQVDLDSIYLYHVAKRIVEKYESVTKDHRKIMRAVTAGEVEVARGLLALARSDKTPAQARVVAYTQLGKMVGMSKESIEDRHGLTIVIQGPMGDQATVPPPGRCAASAARAPAGAPRVSASVKSTDHHHRIKG